MTDCVEKALEKPYWIIDILPARVPADSRGQYFAVEQYWLQAPRISRIREKKLQLILKLNCYRSVSLDEGQTLNPPPERIAEAVGNRRTVVSIQEAVLISEKDETWMTLYNPDESLLGLIRTLASGEGLYVWQPEEGQAASPEGADNQ